MPDRTPVFAANWKMNTTVGGGLDLCQSVRDRLDGERRAEVIICPPFTHLVPLAECLSGSSLILGAQDVYWKPKGAFTGEISPAMLQGLAQYVIIGHSERRAYFGESDGDVNRKTSAALEAGLTPIVCVGETGEQREAGETEGVLRHQVQLGLSGIDQSAGLVVAYEPIWAIGTGVSAHGDQAQEAIAFIRAQVRGLGGAWAEGTRILYGGSVTAANVSEFMTEPDVDGALVGGASLSAESFAELVQAGVAAGLSRSAARP
ncbi:MAG TPA: triose-phosphate isomerase [Dehalococcoidia bacterium]|nr:triose-phosphate isomerase [Dehalococcoidia bacterium]